MNELAALLLTAAIAAPDVAQAAAMDHRQFPKEEWGYLYYLSTESAAEEDRAELAASIRLMVASTSRQPIVERCIPQSVLPGLLYRIDLRDLQWKVSDWHKLLESYPYSKATLPLVVRADWLLVELADATESDAYYRLLLGGENIPATLAEWQDLIGVDRTQFKEFDAVRFGLIEGQSGVAKQEARVLTSHPTKVGRLGLLPSYAWGTEDYFEVVGGNDPLENLNQEVESDGQEWIVGIPKVSLVTGERGVLQVYLLSNGEGQRVDEAPTDLVEDSTRFRGNPEIITPGSCIQCHARGLNEPTINELRELLSDPKGVEVFASDKNVQQQIEAFHLSDTDRSIRRANEDFGAIVKAVTGLEAAEAAAAFKRSVRRYDAPLDLEATARELGVESREWKHALALASGVGAPLGARLAGLAHGRKAPRKTWEERFCEAYSYAHK